MWKCWDESIWYVLCVRKVMPCVVLQRHHCCAHTYMRVRAFKEFCVSVALQPGSSVLLVVFLGLCLLSMIGLAGCAADEGDCW